MDDGEVSVHTPSPLHRCREPMMMEKLSDGSGVGVYWTLMGLVAFGWGLWPWGLDCAWGRWRCIEEAGRVWIVYPTYAAWDAAVFVASRPLALRAAHSGF